MAEGEAPAKKKSDLGVRTASAVVMLAVAGTALWLGEQALAIFVGLVALVALGEFLRLLWKVTARIHFRVLGTIGGIAYIAIGTYALVVDGIETIVVIVGVVIFIDTFAYFFGRAIGGPKIAPKISPSKTWAGLLGGAIGASAFLTGLFQGVPAFECWRFRQLPLDQQFGFDGPCSYLQWNLNLQTIVEVLVLGLIFAVIAQSGDFFESWLKRRAGVKDSSNLIPGHGGVFDRVDGMLAVAFVFSAFQLLTL